MYYDFNKYSSYIFTAGLKTWDELMLNIVHEQHRFGANLSFYIKTGY